jgi:hypothetical protein
LVEVEGAFSGFELSTACGVRDVLGVRPVVVFSSLALRPYLTGGAGVDEPPD